MANPQVTNPRDEGNNEEPSRTVSGSRGLELAITLLGGAVLLASAVYLTFRGAQEQLPPSFEIVLSAPESAAAGFRVPMEIKNTGDEAAQTVEIEVTCVWGGQSAQSSHVTVDWIPGGSARRAVVFFQDDPASGTMKARVEGFQEP